MQRTNEVGGEDEGALEHRDDQKVIAGTLDDILGEFEITLPDLLGGKERFDVLSANNGHGKLLACRPEVLEPAICRKGTGLSTLAVP